MEESEIIRLLRDGERRQAFNMMVRTYSERLYWHLRRMVIDHDDADDLLQNTFMNVWRALDTFREDSRLYTWLYRIATNEALSFLRKEQLKQKLSLSSLSSRLSDVIESDSHFNGDDMQKALHKAISKLPPKQKSVFILRYFDEMKYEEMSEILETSEGALKASYHHAYTKVLAWVKEDLGI